MKIIAVGFIFSLIAIFLFAHFSGKNHILSPFQQNFEFSKRQQDLDHKLFEANKNRLKGEVISWADGEAPASAFVANGEYIVTDGSGKPLLALDPDKRVAPASLTKLITVMVSFDLASSDDLFQAEKKHVGMEPTTIMVDEGEEFNRNELAAACLMTSANDAAQVLADGVAKSLGGSPNLFTMLMNEKVKKLGLVNTHFVNPTGYDNPDQYSTARDLAKIAYYAITAYPEIAKLVNTKEMTLPETNLHKYYELPNWNGLLGVYPGVDGVKIGYTEEAGYDTIVESVRGREKIMVVLLSAPDRRARDFWAAKLLNGAFAKFGIKPFNVSLWMIKKREAEWNNELRRAKENTHVWINKDTGKN